MHKCDSSWPAPKPPVTSTPASITRAPEASVRTAMRSSSACAAALSASAHARSFIRRWDIRTNLSPRSAGPAPRGPAYTATPGLLREPWLTTEAEVPDSRTRRSNGANAFENLALSRLARIPAEAAECTLDERRIDGESVSSREIEERQADVRRLIGAGVAIGRRDGHASTRDDQPALAAAARSIAARAQHEQ